MKKNNGAFGGLYNFQVIKELRSQLAMKSLMLAALVQHTKITQQELQKVTTEYMRENEAKLKNLDKIA